MLVAQQTLIDADEIGQRLKCSRRHVMNMDENGRIPKSHKLGTLRRWHTAEIDAWIHAGCPNRADWLKVRDEYLTVGTASPN